MKPLCVLALLPLLAACAEAPMEPATALTAAGAATGLEQVLDVQVTTENGVGRFTITSTLVNGGTTPLTLEVRSCYLREADLRGEKDGLRLEQPLMLCASDGHRITLAPGEASEPLAIGGSMTPGSRRELEVRHVLSPERWAPVVLAIP